MNIGCSHSLLIGITYEQDQKREQKVKHGQGLEYGIREKYFTEGVRRCVVGGEII